MDMSTGQIWLVIFALGLGTFLIRFSFLGLIGDRPLPGWLLRHLRYTPVAVLPGLVAPLVLWPDATSGSPDPALATLAIGYTTKSVLAAIIGGALTLYGVLFLVG